MKKRLFILSAIALLAACKNSSKQSGEDAAKITAGIEPVIQGTWVMTEYINDLQKTQSPLASSARLQGIVSLNIDTWGHTGDSSSISGSLNNHEGYAFNIYFREGKEENSIQTDLKGDSNDDKYELGYTISNKDTALVLYHYKNDKLADKRSFTKVTGEVSENGEPHGLQYMVNKVLFSGNYTATDDKGKTTDVKFTNDGIVEGFEGHTTYFVFTDFIAESDGYKIDELCLDERTKTQKPFIFEASNDTIRFYAASEDYDRTKLIKGALKYTLVKKQNL